MSGILKSAIIVFYLWAGLFLIATDPRAEPDCSLDSLRVALRYINNFNRNIHHDYWRPEAGIEAGLATHFHPGILEIGGTWVKYTARQNPLPDYHSLYLFVGWGLERKVVTKLKGMFSLRVGDHLMIFEDDYIRPEGRVESELAVEFAGGVSINLSRQTALEISGRYRRVYTYHRLELAYIGLGISHTIASPEWLKRIMR